MPCIALRASGSDAASEESIVQIIGGVVQDLTH
jgi:hypothetical protein